MRLPVTAIMIIIIGATTVVGTTSLIITINIVSVSSSSILTCLLDLYSTSGVRTAHKG